MEIEKDTRFLEFLRKSIEDNNENVSLKALETLERLLYNMKDKELKDDIINENISRLINIVTTDQRTVIRYPAKCPVRPS